MYSTKQNVLQLTSLLNAFHIRHVVLSPGSRNAPLIQTFSQHPDFLCYTQVDERNAGFFALGLIQQLQEPVVICCTSGSALLNYAPAISEAFYQRLPLVVISADRPAAWLGQMDGQTVPQPHQFASITQYSAHIDEIRTPEDLWYANRLINEALIAVTQRDSRPVHINMALSEPLFDYSATELPRARKIDYHITLPPEKSRQFQDAKRKMIIVGQLAPNPALTPLLEKLATDNDCVVLTEHLANQHSPHFASRFDAFLSTQAPETCHDFQPDLVITLGGHIVSKRLKQLLRKFPANTHWHVSETGEIIDLFQSLTDVIALPILPFLSALNVACHTSTSPEFHARWQRAIADIPVPALTQTLTDLTAVNQFLAQLPPDSQLHVANSSPIRHIELFPLPERVDVYCNRGTNGIDGTLSTLFGFAAATEKPVHLLIGDLSFFYNLGALWNIADVKNVRIILLNNGGGGIFHLLPNLNQSASLKKHVSASHQTDAEKWAHAAGLTYLRATDLDSLNTQLPELLSASDSVILEILTDMQDNQAAFSQYYQSIQHKEHKL